MMFWYFHVLLGIFGYMSGFVYILMYLYNFSLIYFKINLMSSMFIECSFNFIFDKFSMIFLFMVLIISKNVLKYSYYYFVGTVWTLRFIGILIFFILSMLWLIMSYDMFTFIVGWDMLGVSSFLLILYYNSYKSKKSSLITYISNRFGDGFFILSMVLVSPLFSEFFTFQFHYLLPILVFCTSITKSAQFPFSSWLPEAMAAPTPVSTLVHSSTLVTAGFYFLFRFQGLWINHSLSLNLLLYVSLFTMTLASTAALMEYDLKKVIALSTLSQISFMFFSLSLKLTTLAFFHMVMHAFFKAATFMIAGVIIHNSGNNQDLRVLYVNNNKLLLLLLLFCQMSLSGFLFLSGFYSKDLIYKSFMEYNNLNYFFMLIFMISVVLTMLYCMRMCLMMMNFMKMTYFLNFKEMSMLLPVMELMFLSIVSGSGLTWYLCESTMIPSKVEFMNYLLFMVMIFMPMISVELLKLNLPFKNFLSSMWFISFFTKKLSFLMSKFLMISLEIDKSGMMGKLKDSLILNFKKMGNSMFLYFSMMKFFNKFMILEFFFLLMILFLFCYFI
uniref:NADH:ubiquinone reductase (H(+)-translocating) n=1 Tax=Heterodoxus spiniger TaxID=762516 RepID=A0A7T1HEY4_9NEOP|nr:NADH dehydrogenase subunit 5 [Heterodoxus spiniger]